MRSRRRVLAAVAACAALLPVPAESRPPTDRSAARQQTPTIKLVSQPITVDPDGTFPVVLEIAGAPQGSDLAVDIYDRLDDPTQVGRMPEDPLATFDPQPLDVDPSGPTTTFFAIHLYRSGGLRPPTPWAYPLDEPGVYPLRVRLRDADDELLSTFVTQLVRRPADDEEVHEAAVGVVTRVHQDPAEDPGRTPVPESYREQLDRVVGALRSHPSVAASFAVTPETLDRLVADEGAAGVLDRLRTEVRRDGRELLDAPYVDLDPSALVAEGLADELTRQRDLGRAALEAKLAPPTAGSWWLPRPIGADALVQLRSRGIFRIATTNRTFRQAPPLAATDLDAGDGAVRAVPVDETYAVGPSSADPTSAAHQLFARLVVAASARGDEAIVVTVDPATADPLVVPTLLDALAFGAPFLETTTLGQLLTETPRGPRAPVADIPPAGLGDYPRASEQAHAALASYTAMVPERPDLTARFQLPLAVSASADLAAADRIRLARQVELRLERRFDGISTPPRDRVTLGARDAEFPVIITSTLNYPVQVLVSVRASDRLSFPQERIAAELRPDGRTVVPVRVHTRASGDTPVDIDVRSADGSVVLTSTQYTIRSTAVSGVGLLLTVGAALFLAVWWARHWRRSRRTPKHARGQSDRPAPPTDEHGAQVRPGEPVSPM